MLKELLTLPEHMSSPPCFIVGFVLLNLLFSVKCFVDSCLSVYPFSFDHCVVLSVFDIRTLISRLVSPISS
jgi:hypothetical protein